MDMDIFMDCTVYLEVYLNFKGLQAESINLIAMAKIVFYTVGSSSSRVF